MFGFPGFSIATVFVFLNSPGGLSVFTMSVRSRTRYYHWWKCLCVSSYVWKLLSSTCPSSVGGRCADMRPAPLWYWNCQMSCYTLPQQIIWTRLCSFDSLLPLALIVLLLVRILPHNNAMRPCWSGIAMDATTLAAHNTVGTHFPPLGHSVTNPLGSQLSATQPQ